ncbi:glycosyltransferase [Rhodosalinus sp. FB01]|uniref:glycosyltransferase n=1 Tax=Rhodosalinus sp. FB01 TaxID=3239194 RepID=UPI0035241E2B
MMGPIIRTLVPMACDGNGPSFTCVNLLRGMKSAGLDTHLYVTRNRLSIGDLPHANAVPSFLSWVPYTFVEAPASRRIENWFLSDIKPGELAYLWPAASLDAHRQVYKQGNPIIMEAINTRMLRAKEILDQAYEDFGSAPQHSITRKRIEEEEIKLEYASAIFTSNREVEKALQGSHAQNKILSSSYGINLRNASPQRNYEEKKSLKYMFCGFACVRKGVHFLLEAWKKMPENHQLILVGDIEPIIRDKYSDLLSSEHVKCVGFVKNVHPWLADADVFVFPSLEEGGPQVTFEAAMHGLPIIASPMGASRLGEIEGTMEIVNPTHVEAMLEKMLSLSCAEKRAKLGRKAREEVEQFDWMKIGARRTTLLADFFHFETPLNFER